MPSMIKQAKRNQRRLRHKKYTVAILGIVDTMQVGSCYGVDSNGRLAEDDRRCVGVAESLEK